MSDRDDLYLPCSPTEKEVGGVTARLIDRHWIYCKWDKTPNPYEEMLNCAAHVWYLAA